MTDSERRARVALSFIADPGDVVLGAALQTATATEILAAIKGSDTDGNAVLAGAAEGHAGRRSFAKWRNRVPLIPAVSALAAWQERGMRLIIPGDPEWPAQLDDLGDARPLVLWLRGTADLRSACLQSVAVVGSRACTAYGENVALELAASLADRGWAIISGGAYGIDTGAHRGAIAVGGCTVAVLGSGLSYAYPQGQHGLFEAIAEHGALVSECPPYQPPTRPGFLIRNRLIAALGRGTVVVQAALRSGALNTARHARELCRPVTRAPSFLRASVGCSSFGLGGSRGDGLARSPLAGHHDTTAPGFPGAADRLEGDAPQSAG